MHVSLTYRNLLSSADWSSSLGRIVGTGSSADQQQNSWSLFALSQLHPLSLTSFSHIRILILNFFLNWFFSLTRTPIWRILSPLLFIFLLLCISHNKTRTSPTSHSILYSPWSIMCPDYWVKVTSHQVTNSMQVRPHLPSSWTTWSGAFMWLIFCEYLLAASQTDI